MEPHGNRGEWDHNPILTLALLAAIALLPPGGAVAEPVDPFPLRNQLPFHLPFLDQTPRGASLLGPRQVRLTFHLAYENTAATTDELVALFRQDNFATFDGEVSLPILQNVAAGMEGGSAFFLDGETLRAVIDAAIGIGSRLELSVEVPMLLHTGGIFDSMIDSYHERVGLPDGGRPVFARNRFVAGYVGDGEAVFIDRSPGGVRLGDIVLVVRTALNRAAAGVPAVASSFSLKLPTGDADRLDGSGSVDYGVGLQVSWELGRSTFHGGYAYSFLGDWALAPGLPLRDNRSLSLGYGFSLGSRSSLVAQILRTSGPFPFRSGSDLGRTSMEIALGFRHRLGERTALGWSVIENLTSDLNTPDIGLFLGLTYRPGAAARHPKPKNTS